MSPWTLALRGLRHFRRAHVGVVLGCACATAVLVGALAVGDSVRLSLRQQAALRIGQFDAALVARERWVRADLASELSSAASASVEPVLSLQGIAGQPAPVEKRFLESEPFKSLFWHSSSLTHE